MPEAGRIDLYLPILVPLATAVAAAFLGKLPRTRRAISVAGSAALLACGLWLVVQVRHEGVIASHTGSWPAPFGITLVADLLSAVLVVAAGGIAVAVTTFSVAGIDALRERGGFHSLVHVLLMGVCGALLTGDLFNLYVWFEVMLVSSFILMALGGTKSQMEASLYYVTLNLLASALFLAGTGVLYGMVGSLNMADVSLRMRDLAGTPYPYILAALFLVAFGIKAAAFPLFFWLPASYHTPPIAVTTLFSALLTKVGVYAIIRMTTLVFAAQADTIRPVLLAVAGLTMVTGVLGAIAQGEMRRLLAFHIVSQIGYLLMGAALGTSLALAATVFFFVHVIAAKSALFMVTGIVRSLRRTSELADLGGLARGSPLLAGLFLVPALALAGLPPLSGFWAKFALVKAALDVGSVPIAITALAVSLLTLYSMTKIWTEAFWKPAPGGAPQDAPGAPRAALVVPALVLGAVTVLMGFGAEPFFALSLRAAEQLLDPAGYISVVLGP
jgi:multicomponent Na+:H+ antiporter subunit D